MTIKDRLLGGNPTIRLSRIRLHVIRDSLTSNVAAIAQRGRLQREAHVVLAGLLRKRKGKEVASSSEGARFKSPYHEAHFNSKLSARKILPELIIKVDENILDPCAFQIEKRKWERLTNPIQAVGQNMVREFYANAWEPEKEKRKPYTYTTMVRGKEISFAPNNIKRVLKLRKDPLLDAASYEERVANKDYRLDHDRSGDHDVSTDAPTSLNASGSADKIGPREAEQKWKGPRMLSADLAVEAALLAVSVVAA
ncbi:hypothetical protein PIB30_062860 [Stylosanthes scabra]|uniref:Putative plant transposon protein domain-containing protein n=1 Tax=Stylosanthes scabra TaxID=79078 RepID=A0ABU6QLV9_9FABA|nr:hypothetical protein [Stylosanthes scabra]